MPEKREKIQFRTNQPVAVTMIKTDALEVPGFKGGYEYMYTVHGESGAEAVMFVPPAAAADIDRAKLSIGDTIQVTKQAGGNWEVVHVEAPLPQQHSYQPQQRPAAPPVSQPRGGPQPAAILSQQARTEEDRLTEQLAASVKSQPAYQQTASSIAVLTAFKAVIDAAAEVEAYSASKGFPLRFDGDAIRALATTVLINRSKEGK